MSEQHDEMIDILREDKVNTILVKLIQDFINIRIQVRSYSIRCIFG